MWDKEATRASRPSAPDLKPLPLLPSGPDGVRGQSSRRCKREPPLTHSNGGEGGITHRSTPRPFGAALTGVIPLRRCLRRLIAGNTAYHLAERVGLLVAPLLAPSGPPWRALSPLRRCLGRLIDAT